MPPKAPAVGGRGGPTTAVEVTRWRSRLEKEEVIARPATHAAYKKVRGLLFQGDSCCV
jgi:hypothetical protein